jgi:hypothetical protein
VKWIIWKLTGGEQTNVPASHGQWAGYRTSKAVAWVIDVGPEKPAWLARYKDQCSGPLPLREAKAVAQAMLRALAATIASRIPLRISTGLRRGY